MGDMTPAHALHQGPRHRERLRPAARRRCAPRPRRRPGASAGRPARRHRRRRRHPGRAHRVLDRGGRAGAGRSGRRGSWTTATRTVRSPRCAATAPGSSRHTCVVKGSETADEFEIATRGGIKGIRFEGAARRGDRHQHGALALPRPDQGAGRRLRRPGPLRDRPLAEDPWSALSVDMGNPHTVVALPESVDLDALDLFHAPEVRPVPPHGTNVEFVRVVGPGAHRPARPRAWRRRDPLLRDRRLRGRPRDELLVRARRADSRLDGRRPRRTAARAGPARPRGRARRTRSPRRRRHRGPLRPLTRRPTPSPRLGMRYSRVTRSVEA